VRHEQAATHAADGYARSTGKPGVVLVTSGPGATNAVTGIATAYMDSIPMVVITGQVPTSLIGNDAFQEVDSVGITRPCVKHNFLVKDVKDLTLTLKKAFYLATTGRPGPVVVDIPKDVTLSVKARNVTVTGPKGTLNKSFKHLSLDMYVVGKTKKVLVIEMWFVNSKNAASIRTVGTLINNMIVGVTKGYQYKMRLVYAHFPINATVADNGKVLEIRNFLGEKEVRKIAMLEGVSVERTDQKDEIALTGISLENVSQSAANIQQSTRVKNKDIRKFLDGIYVSEKIVLGMD
jgi:ribosomal protein L6P/L9E